MATTSVDPETGVGREPRFVADRLRPTTIDYYRTHGILDRLVVAVRLWPILGAQYNHSELYEILNNYTTRALEVSNSFMCK